MTVRLAVGRVALASLVVLACGGRSVLEFDETHASNASPTRSALGTGGTSAAGTTSGTTSGASGDDGGLTSGNGTLLLASGQLAPVAVMSDKDNVYWLNEGTFTADLKAGTPDGNASVMKCSRQGCNGAPTALAENRAIGQFSSNAFAFDGHYLYWNDATPPLDGDVVRCSIDGCANGPEFVRSSRAYALYADATRLYGVEFEASAFSCEPPDCDGTTTTLWSAGYSPAATNILADANAAYFLTEAVPEVLACAATGCNNAPLVVMPPTTDLASTTELGQDENNLFIADTNPCAAGEIDRCEKTGCPNGPTPIATQLSQPAGLISDGRYVYFVQGSAANCNVRSSASASPPSLDRCDVQGCPNGPETLASGFTLPSALALDDQSFFVTDAGSGDVWRIAR